MSITFSGLDWNTKTNPCPPARPPNAVANGNAGQSEREREREREKGDVFIWTEGRKERKEGVE